MEELEKWGNYELDKYLSEDEQEPIQDEIENKWAYEEGRY